MAISNRIQEVSSVKQEGSSPYISLKDVEQSAYILKSLAAKPFAHSEFQDLKRVDQRSTLHTKLDPQEYGPRLTTSRLSAHEAELETQSACDPLQLSSFQYEVEQLTSEGEDDDEHNFRNNVSSSSSLPLGLTSHARRRSESMDSTMGMADMDESYMMPLETRERR